MHRRLRPPWVNRARSRTTIRKCQAETPDRGSIVSRIEQAVLPPPPGIPGRNLAGVWSAVYPAPASEYTNRLLRKQSLYCYHASRRCAAIRRRSRCGPVRGWPVLSWHFSPGATPHVGQATASICCAVSSFFIAEKEYFKPLARVCTLAHPLKGSG